MIALMVAVIFETLWLLTIYGKRFFDWWDCVEMLVDDELDIPPAHLW